LDNSHRTWHAARVRAAGRQPRCALIKTNQPAAAPVVWRAMPPQTGRRVARAAKWPPFRTKRAGRISKNNKKKTHEQMSWNKVWAERSSNGGAAMATWPAGCVVDHPIDLSFGQALDPSWSGASRGPSSAGKKHLKWANERPNDGGAALATCPSRPKKGDRIDPSFGQALYPSWLGASKAPLSAEKKHLKWANERPNYGGAALATRPLRPKKSDRIDPSFGQALG
jgi:hypothetical protein